jgi:hypothetical protein
MQFLSMSDQPRSLRPKEFFEPEGFKGSRIRVVKCIILFW